MFLLFLLLCLTFLNFLILLSLLFLILLVIFFLCIQRCVYVVHICIHDSFFFNCFQLTKQFLSCLLPLMLVTVSNHRSGGARCNKGKFTQWGFTYVKSKIKYYQIPGVFQKQFLNVENTKIIKSDAFCKNFTKRREWNFHSYIL